MFKIIKSLQNDNQIFFYLKIMPWKIYFKIKYIKLIAKW